MNSSYLREFEQAREEYALTEKAYISKGYTLPVNTMVLIGNMYKQLGQNLIGENSDDAREEISELGVLKMLTLTKLLNTSTSAIESRPDGFFKLTFINGAPNNETANFLNLKNDEGEFLNYEATSLLKLPEGLPIQGNSNIVTYSVSRDGEEFFLQNNLQNVEQ